MRRRAWGAVRRAKRRRRYRDKFDAVPATFEMVVAEPASLRRIRWAHLDADEGHRHTFVTRGYWRSCTRCTPSFAPLASVPILYRAPRASRALIVQDGPPRQAADHAHSRDFLLCVPSMNRISVRHTGHLYCFGSAVQRSRPSRPHQCMHGWMLHHAREPIPEWKSLLSAISRSMGQIAGDGGTTSALIILLTRMNNKPPATCTSLAGVAAMWQSLSEGRELHTVR